MGMCLLIPAGIKIDPYGADWFISDGYMLCGIYLVYWSCMHCIWYKHCYSCQLPQRQGRLIINGFFLSTPCPIDVWDAMVWERDIWSRDYWTDVTLSWLRLEYSSWSGSLYHHDDVMTWKCFLHYWHFVRGIQWCIAMVVSLLLA